MNDTRHIKFRGKGERVPLWYYSEGDSDSIVFWHNLAAGHIKKETLSQFTGLKDINDVDVYGGDILRFTHENGNKYIGKVYFNRGQLAYYIKTMHGRFNIQLCRLNNINDKFQGFEVVGNIFDNPDIYIETPEPVTTKI